jgi:hypothetical protein
MRDNPVQEVPMRKLVLFVALLCVLPVFSFAQSSSGDKVEMIDQKIQEYTRMRNNGRSLALIGAGAEIVGVLVYYAGISDLNADLVIGGGVIEIAGAIACTVGGYMWWAGYQGVITWEAKKVDVSLAPTIGFPEAGRLGVGLQVRLRKAV